MSDCSTAAYEQCGIHGQVNWQGGLRPSPLSFPRVVNGVKRVADTVDIDGETFGRQPEDETWHMRSGRIVAIERDGLVYALRETCTMTQEYAGYPCSDFRCSACGKVHNAPHADEFCSRCGAMVVGVERCRPRRDMECEVMNEEMS